jgi:hypothetical protein
VLEVNLRLQFLQIQHKHIVEAHQMSITPKNYELTIVDTSRMTVTCTWSLLVVELFEISKLVLVGGEFSKWIVTVDRCDGIF